MKRGLSRQDKVRIDALMQSGILIDKKTGITYYTGYSYRTLYDWDQYFEAIIQLNMGWGTKYIIDGVKVFLESQRADGFIVRLNQAVFSGNSDSIEHAKPFFAQIALMTLKYDGHADWLDDYYYEKLKKYLLYWLNVEDVDKNGLASWQSGPHTGMDNQHERCGYWADKFCEGADLNSYLYRDLIAFSALADYRGEPQDTKEFLHYADTVKKNINGLLWDEKEGFYFDRNEKTGKSIKVKTAAGFMPLWAGIADETRAKRVIQEHILNEKEFWRSFPVSTMSATEKGYSETRLPDDLGCNWRANTWIPINYIVMQVLERYGYRDKAEEIANVSFDTVKRIGEREYYTSDSVQGCGLSPFWGWSLLAYFMPEDLNEGTPYSKIIKV